MEKYLQEKKEINFQPLLLPVSTLGRDRASQLTGSVLYRLEVSRGTHTSGDPYQLLRFDTMLEQPQNSGKFSAHKYSFITAKKYKSVPAKRKDV